MSEDEDIDWDDWMAMSDKQQDAILDNSMREYQNKMDSLSPLELYRHRRHFALITAAGWRKLARQGFVPEFSREHLRQVQLRLLAIRVELYSGRIVGHA
jgi:hypothetical protein